MPSQSKQLAELIKKLIRQELKELSVTGGIDGGEGPPKTPYAFKDPKDDDKDEDVCTNGLSLQDEIKVCDAIEKDGGHVLHQLRGGR